MAPLGASQNPRESLDPIEEGEDAPVGSMTPLGASQNPREPLDLIEEGEDAPVTHRRIHRRMADWAVIGTRVIDGEAAHERWRATRSMAIDARLR